MFCYFISSALIVFLFYNKLGLNNFTLLMTIYILSLMYQIVKFKKNNPNECLKAFKINNYSGFFLFFGISLIN